MKKTVTPEKEEIKEIKEEVIKNVVNKEEKINKMHEETNFNLWIDVLILIVVIIMFAIILYGYIVSA